MKRANFHIFTQHQYGVRRSKWYHSQSIERKDEEVKKNKYKNWICKSQGGYLICLNWIPKVYLKLESDCHLFYPPECVGIFLKGGQKQVREEDKRFKLIGVIRRKYSRKICQKWKYWFPAKDGIFPISYSISMVIRHRKYALM